MGKRGPAKTPTKQLGLRGSWRERQRQGEPETLGKPKCPAWLNKDEKKHFKSLVEKFAKINLAGELDTDKIALYVSLFFRFRAAKKTGDVKIMIRIAPMIDRIGSQFGMSPSARANMSIEMPKKDVEKQEFFNRKCI